MRRLAPLVAACAALWLAPGALAAGWCGSGETAVDLPDLVAGAQIHAVVVLPSDGSDTFATVSARIADDVTSLTAWWTAQDLTRTPRFDQAAYPGGTCLDLSFLRLREPGGSLTDARIAFNQVLAEVEAAGLSHPFKDYLVYYDGPAVQRGVCGTGLGSLGSGRNFAVVWLQGCPTIGSDGVAAHELVHALGALPVGAPNWCRVSPVDGKPDTGHPCDSVTDLLYPQTDGRPLQAQVLDFNHDDYYAHSGAWDDLQDSMFLRHLDLPQVPLSVATAGGVGNIVSDLPGLDCSTACTTQWDQNTTVSLSAVPGRRSRFVRWAGACNGNVICTLRLAGPVAVTAVFGPALIPVKVTTSGRGTVRCTPACSKAFPAGEPLRLRAVAARGWVFSRWSGSCTGKAPLCRPKTSAAVSARATFRRA